MKTMSLIAAIALVTLPAFAQVGSTGQISGRVTDPSSAVLPGVEITATQTETGLVRSVVTNEAGLYSLPNLPIGPYKVEAALPGFRTFVQSGVVLQVNSKLAIDVTLQVGEVVQTVEVQANSELQVETRGMSIGTMMERERILELPLGGRKVTDLVVLTGAAVQVGQSPTWGMNTGVNISAAGGRGFGVGYSLDGAMHTNRFDATNMPLPFPDSLQEFRVNTSTQDASTARSSGASVSSVTKSGTNAFHGDVFWYVRNSVFNAQQASATRKDQLKRNQFGGTIGGPVLKNKLFFFAGYQGTEERNTPSGTLSIVPTAAILRGDWTRFNQCFSPNWKDKTSDLAKGSIDPAKYSKAAMLLAAKLPQPQDDCGNLRWGSPIINSEKQIVQRVDYQRSAKQSFFGRYFTVMQDSPVPYDKANLLTAGPSGNADRARMLVGGHTWVINPNMVNTARFTNNRISVYKIGPTWFSPQDVGINTYTSVPGHFNFSVTGFFNFGSGTGGAGRHLWQDQYQLGDDVTLTRGKHQLSFGGAWSRDQWVNVAHARSVGVITVDTTNTNSTGNALGDFMLGNVSQIRQAMPETFSQYQHYFGFYGQDTWRATSRLTVNYGLRWEPFIPPVWYSDDRNPLGGFQTYRFSVDAFKAGTKSAVFPTAPAGFLYPSQKADGSGPADITERSGVPADWKKVGPRVGLAWDPTGKGTTSLRAGYSLAYDVVNLQVILNAAGVSPWAGDTIYRNGTVDNPWQGSTNPFPFDWRTNPRFIDGAVFLPFANDLQSTYAQSWNLSLQQQFSRRWLVSASYLGSATPHLWSTSAVNGAVYLTQQAYPSLFTSATRCVLEGVAYDPCNTTGNINQRRELRLWAAMNKPALLNDAKQFSNIDAISSVSTANYNALLLSVKGEIHGVSLNANHTWSHCISDRTNDGVPNPNGTFQRDRDRSNCASDRRHIFNLTAVADSPKFEGRWLRAVASNWKLSTVYRVSTGSFLTVSSGADRALSGLATQTADQISGNVYLDGPITLNSLFLNKNAFDNPALGAYGNMMPNSIRGLKTWNLDAALARVFKIKERHQVEVRAEAFNLPNAVKPLNPNTTLTNVNFGKITSVADPRIMQFALKYMF